MSLAMTVSEREDFLSGVHVGIVSIPRKVKGPLAVPVWYDYEPGGQPWFITSKSSIKGKLLNRADRISLCAQTEEPPYKYVSVEGPFTVSGSSHDELLHMATRYLGGDQGRAYAQASVTDETSIIVRIEPVTWYTVDYSKR
ncbi:MAG: pyridoxamine 5'-phosphate oxidase family protein [Pseudomonadales bacterium]|nr:pyridoxamine 5'-phosphate oxidase family protein [Pseudomonadales bacterium]